MTGGARRFGRRCRHDFEVAEAHHHQVEQQPRQQQGTADQPRKPDHPDSDHHDRSDAARH